MNGMIHDLRYAVRTLLKAPGFATVVVLTFALGIAAITTVFSVVNAVLLRPLPYSEPDRLVRLYQTFHGGRGIGPVSFPNFRDWRDQTRSFEDLAAYFPQNLNLQGVDHPERLSVVAATVNLFGLLGVLPQLGRTFLPGEDEPGAGQVAMLSDGMWQQRFGADPAVVGQSLMLDGDTYTVVGVLPPDFRFPAGRSGPDLWVPLKATPDRAEARNRYWLPVIGRLHPGVSLAAAQTEMSDVGRRIEEQQPRAREGGGILLRPLRDVAIGDVRLVLLMLLGAAALVLLIACANTANLMLARSIGRRREIAVRTAMGATRARVAQQFLVEALVLALVGAAVGLLLASHATTAVVALAGPNLPRAAEIGLDGRTFGILLLVTVACAAAFGLMPVLLSRGGRLNEDLTDGCARTSGGRGGLRFRSVLVIGQVALSLVLLVGAGLLFRTVGALLATDTGMQTENVLTMHVAIPPDRYPEGDMVARFHGPVLEQVEALPGVRVAGWTSHLPLDEWGSGSWFHIEGRPEPASPAETPYAELRLTSPGYFEALGIPILRGRDFGSQDGIESPAALINRTMAERYFPDEDPVGHRLRIYTPVPIIGVVGDVRQAELARNPLPEMYVPYDLAARFGVPKFTLVVNAQVPPTALAGAVREAIRAVNPDQPAYNVQTMQQVVAGSIAERRLYLWLFATFAGVALALAVAGVYGVMSYSVSQRAREIGIRMALGASPAEAQRLVIRHGAWLALLGVVIGAPAAVALTRLLRGLLFGVTPTDPATLGAVAIGLAAVALLASYLPARRASRVDPMNALKAD